MDGWMALFLSYLSLSRLCLCPVSASVPSPSPCSLFLAMLGFPVVEIRVPSKLILTYALRFSP
jgi:hypothetical protein